MISKFVLLAFSIALLNGCTSRLDVEQADTPERPQAAASPVVSSSPTETSMNEKNAVSTSQQKNTQPIETAQKQIPVSTPQTQIDPKLLAETIVVKLQPTNVMRPGRPDMNSNNWDNPAPEKLSRGELMVGKERAVIYIPTQGPYTNNSRELHSLGNTSTIVSVDANRDQSVDASENWFSNLPVRIGDQMFDVIEFDRSGKWIRLAHSRARLSGAVIGRPLPPFSLITTDGKRISLADYKGKNLLLDVWSMT